MNKVRNLADSYDIEQVFDDAVAGDTVGDGQRIYRDFAIQCKAQGAVTSWTILLEGSLNGEDFDTILEHTDVDPMDGKILWLGNVCAPTKYYRVNCTAIVLGAGTSVTAWAVGI